MAERCKDLPDECWELILNRLDHHSDLEALSLVCKRFLSISNRLRTSFAIVNPTILIHGTMSKLFRRFRHLKFIDLSEFHGDIDTVIHEIAQSGLNLETLNVSNQNCLPLEGLKMLGLSMKNLKVLNCADLMIFRDIELVVLASSLPRLEELDISHPRNYFDLSSALPLNFSEMSVTDSGIAVLSSKLANLKKINISGNHFITDKSLVALSSNCVFLREIVVKDCSFITQIGILFVTRHSPNLSSISVNGIQIPPGSSHFEDPLSYPRTLCTLDFYDLVISDEFLYSIAKACIPLKRLTLSKCSNFTVSGISLILYTYQALEYLAFVEVEFLTDQAMTDLSQYLHNLVTIKLKFCSKLTNSTFFTLAKNCPLLKDIEMEKTNLGKEDSTSDFVKNPQIKSLNLAWNLHLTDECLKKVAFICPKLETLDVCSCSGITEGGIAEILKNCCEIRRLRIDDCGGIKSIGMGSKLFKLEIFQAACSGIDDKGLAMVGERCCGLLNLDLEGCLEVTTGMVKEVVKNCKRLREINLKRCQNVNASIVDWMVFSGPSLRKIIPPYNCLRTENQKKLYLCHGCLVC